MVGDNWQQKESKAVLNILWITQFHVIEVLNTEIAPSAMFGQVI